MESNKRNFFSPYLFKKYLTFLASFPHFTFMVLLFLITFVPLGCIYHMYSFRLDDFGIIWYSRINSLNDIFKFFLGDSTITIVQPSNFRVPPNEFLSVFYRPMSYIFYAVQTFFFNFSPHQYFLVKILFHSINVILLHYLFALFTRNQLIAFLAALLFAYHPTLAGSGGIGWITLQCHTINLTLLLLCIIFIKWYLDSNQKRFLLLSLFLFCLSLFHIETALFFPLIAMLGIYFYKNNKYLSIKTGLLFSLMSLFYLISRLAIYPIKSNGNWAYFLERINPLTLFQSRFFDIINLACELAYIPWLGSGHKIMKLIILSSFIGIIFTLFFLSKNKKFLLLLFFSFLIMMLPAVIRYYTSRYLYTTLPFFILFFLSAIVDGTLPIPSRFKKISLLFTTIFIFANGFFVVLSLQTLSKESFIIKNALQELTSKKEILNKKLCFIGLPSKWFRTGIAQAIWMQGINNNYPIYNDQQTSVFSDAPSLVLKTTPIKHGFRLTILNTNDASFYLMKDINLFMGSSFVHKQMNNNILDISYTLEKQWLNEDPYFVTWDYQKNTFSILGYIKNQYK